MDFRVRNNAEGTWSDVAYDWGTLVESSWPNVNEWGQTSQRIDLWDRWFGVPQTVYLSLVVDYETHLPNIWCSLFWPFWSARSGDVCGISSQLATKF